MWGAVGGPQGGTGRSGPVVKPSNLGNIYEKLSGIGLGIFGLSVGDGSMGPGSVMNNNN